MYSCVRVLQKSAATSPFVESHDTSTIRFVPDDFTLMPPDAVPSAWAHSSSGAGGLIFNAFRHTPRRSGG